MAGMNLAILCLKMFNQAALAFAAGDVASCSARWRYLLLTSLAFMAPLNNCCSVEWHTFIIWTYMLMQANEFLGIVWLVALDACCVQANLEPLGNMQWKAKVIRKYWIVCNEVGHIKILFKLGGKIFRQASASFFFFAGWSLKQKNSRDSRIFFYFVELLYLYCSVYLLVHFSN